MSVSRLAVVSHLTICQSSLITRYFSVDTLLQHTIYNPIMVASLMSSHVQVAEVTAPSPLQDVPLARTFHSKERHSTITPSDLSERWCTGLGQATQSFKATTQWLMCSAILLLA